MSQKDTAATYSQTVAIPLSKGKKSLVSLGGCFLMLFTASAGSAVAVIQSVLLEQMGAMQHFALVSVMGTVGLALMTPVGGKLGEIIGRKRLVIIASLMAVVCTLGMALTDDFVLFFIFRIGLTFAQGAFIAIPYILARLINEPKDVPKSMGMLATFVSVGTLAGPLIAGLLSGQGMFALAIGFSAIFPVISVICYLIALPENKNPNKSRFDVPGVLLLAIVILAFVLPLNYAGALGWTHPLIIGGLVLMVVSLVAFVAVETRMESIGVPPIISMRLLKNPKYTSLIIVGICCYFYQSAMTSYGALAAIQVLGAPLAITGSLLLPRTIITMILPMLSGIWLGKKRGRAWKAMAIGSGLIAVAFLPLGFINASSSLILLFVCFGATGIAESFRAVSVTPSAQELLKPEDLATGTSLLNFFNTMAAVLASTLFGTLYNSFNAGGTDIGAGVRPVFVTAGAVAFVGFLIVVFYVRKFQVSNSK